MVSVNSELSSDLHVFLRQVEDAIFLFPFSLAYSHQIEPLRYPYSSQLRLACEERKKEELFGSGEGMECRGIYINKNHYCIL